MFRIDADNKRLKDNIVAACQALIEFGRPNETNPVFWWDGYDFCNGMNKCVVLDFWGSDGKLKTMKITANNYAGEIYKVIKINLK